MKKKSRFDTVMEAADCTGKWGVVCLVLGIVTSVLGVLIGTSQIVCGAILMKKKKELSDAV